MQFLLTLKTICGEKKPNNEKELLDRMNITLAEPYVATFDYLQALTHLKEITYPCPEANVKLAKLLYNCPDWIFPEIAQWQNRYALIVALMASNNEELKDDEKMILYNVIESLEQSRQTFVSHGPLLTPQLKTRCLQWLEGKADAVKPFYDLLSREHVESYFRYHSMKIRLKEALSRNASSQTPRSLPFLQPLSDAVEFHLSGCGAHLPPLHPPSDVEALQLLVDCCLTLASSDHLQEAFQNLQVHFNSPLIQKWMASIPAFTDSLKAYLNNSPDLT
jgi:hypothetical protein